MNELDKDVLPVSSLLEENMKFRKVLICWTFTRAGIQTQVYRSHMLFTAHNEKSCLGN